jgi:hypothetical protein
MKRFTKIILASVVATAGIITLVSFVPAKTKAKAPAFDYGYNIVNVSNNVPISPGVYQWVWTLTNPNPGNGLNGTNQDVSHWDIPLNEQAEAALVSAEYSYDGVTYFSANPEMRRDPSIRLCTTTDVLKFEAGTSGSAPTYFRLCLSAQFAVQPNSTSYIKTGGGQTGCNIFLFTGVGSFTGN